MFTAGIGFEGNVLNFVLVEFAGAQGDDNPLEWSQLNKVPKPEITRRDVNKEVADLHAFQVIIETKNSAFQIGPGVCVQQYSEVAGCGISDQVSTCSQLHGVPVPR